MSNQDFREFDPNETEETVSGDVIDESTGGEEKDSTTDDHSNDKKPTEFCYMCHRPDNICGHLSRWLRVWLSATTVCSAPSTLWVALASVAETTQRAT